MFALRMKRMTAILLWVSFGLLWICGSLSVSALESPYTPTQKEGIYATSVRVVEFIRDSSSVYELPEQVRVPASSRTQHFSRMAPALATPQSPASLAAFVKTGSYVPSSPIPAVCAGRSVDRYVYGLRKIVV